MINSSVSLLLTLLLAALQQPTASLATKSSVDEQNQHNRHSHYSSSPYHLKIRIVSPDLSAPLRKPSYVDQSATSETPHDENRIDPEQAVTINLGCNVDRVSKLTNPSPFITSDGSTVSKGNTLNQFRPRRNVLHRNLPTSNRGREIYTDKARDSESLGRFVHDKSAGDDVRMGLTRTRRTTDGQQRERKSISRGAFLHLNPWSRHLSRLHGLRQKFRGRVGRRLGSVAPEWMEKRNWEDIDMPAWGKRSEHKSSVTVVDSLDEPQENLTYDDIDDSKHELLTKEHFGWEKRNWGDVDMHAWGKRSAEGLLQYPDNINAVVNEH